MEARQFYNRYISPLVTKSFACKWSEDNRLSVLTEKGVHIFEMIPSPAQANPIINVSRSFVYSPESLPTDVYREEVLDGIFDWKKNDVFSFLLNEAYVPNFPKTAKMTPEIIDVVWSPRKLVHPSKCLLALVTSAGAVELAVQVDRNWISIHQFSSAWIEVINGDLGDLSDDKKADCQAITQRIQRLLATSLTWSCMYYENDGIAFAYLVIAHRNSEIAIWKVYRIVNDISCINDNINVKLQFKKKLISENLKINTLLWVSLNEKNYFLIVGFFNGQIGTLKLQEFESGITSSFFLMNYDDIDNIPVDFLYVLQQTEKWIEIVIVKGMYLLILILDINGKTISMKFISSPGFSITGASVFNPNKILITTQDGNICVIEKSDDQNLICIPIKSDILKNNIQYLGLASSQNNLIVTLVTSPGSMYDHLIDRDPSNVCFFNLLNTSSSDPVDILYSNKQQSLLDYWDCLELIKINALKYNNLSTIISKIAINLESLSPYELRIAYWIMIISETSKKKNNSNINSDEVPKLTEEIEQAKSYIFLHSATNHLNRLAVQENLTDIQKLYLSLLRNHLDIWLAGEEEEAETTLSQRVKQVLEATNKFELILQENCNLCGVPIIEPWALCCSSGHKLPRCAITCLQVTRTKFRSCIVCREVFHPCLDLEMDEIKCLYCDLPVYYRHQTIDFSLAMSEKNLSRKRVIVAVANKDTKEDGDN